MTTIQSNKTIKFTDSSNSLSNCTRENLQSFWNLYFHDPFDNNWDKKSFYNIYTLNTISDFWDIFNSLKPFLNSCMFFFMRNNIIPLW